MTDPIIRKAVDLKKEVADLKNPEIDRLMGEIMSTILGATKPKDDRKK